MLNQTKPRSDFISNEDSDIDTVFNRLYNTPLQKTIVAQTCNVS